MGVIWSRPKDEWIAKTETHQMTKNELRAFLCTIDKKSEGEWRTTRHACNGYWGSTSSCVAEVMIYRGILYLLYDHSSGFFCCVKRRREKMGWGNMVELDTSFYWAKIKLGRPGKGKETILGLSKKVWCWGNWSRLVQLLRWAGILRGGKKLLKIKREVQS